MRPGRKRQLVDEARTEWKVSIRRACEVVGAVRSTYHYGSVRPDQASLRKRIREIAEARVRFGYRRIHVLLCREGWRVNEKRIYRLYREERLQLRKKTPRRRVKAALRDDRAPPSRSNEVWAMDFVHDQLATGRKMRVLTVVDAFSRYAPVLDACFAHRGEDVVRTLDQTCRRTGYPKCIRVDPGSEFISRDLDLWAYQQDVTLDFSRHGA